MADPHRSLIRRSSGQDVSAWLSHAHQVFEGLSTEDRFRTLVSFMDVCSAEERWRWQRELTDRFHRDLISWLPVELAVNILGYLDLGSLLNAAQVNRIWQSRADSHHELWRQHGDESGVRSPSAVESVRDWKSALRTAIKVRRELRVGRAFDHHVISDIPLFNGYFTALDFDQGFLAAASVDTLELMGPMERRTVTTQFCCELKVRIEVPVAKFHKRTVESPEPDTSKLSSWKQIIIQVRFPA
eukprot:maker-scaffold742_size103727-snap-gene-0.23 protein:Tk09079 transcript:maker-scaffold742_size103727-snap-gene-0.23-mRNA-1 annotation:"f-box and wd-40 domain protein 7"